MNTAYVDTRGILYIHCPEMISETAITRRFLACLAEVLITHTQAEVAKTLSNTSPYLTKIKTAKNPKIPVVLIARFCEVYGYSPHYILMGQGKPKGAMPVSKEVEMISKLVDALTASGKLDKDTKQMVRAMAKKK